MWTSTVMLALQMFALILIVPTVIYFLGHRLCRPFPKLFNALHVMFGSYMFSVVLAGLTVLIVN
ncbi:hypothetical protein JOC36_000043 [Weissella uvarum]|uniref:hypothetical protein n=1 Tax=Weissella uvarum TaxID=1479233 RepID=UPI001960872E|nr:hypothetical protein [Weissella uvarum]MBM7616510.1 hypothetical protein [Weissella uvarum]MCM0595029.1 hypothetical protein [Weissella uvarum]